MLLSFLCQIWWKSLHQRDKEQDKTLLPFLAAALDRTQASDRKAARSLGYDPLTLVINRNTTSRSRKVTRAKFVQNIQINFMQKKHLQFIGIRNVEAIEYFCFCFQLRIKLVASEFVSASSLFLQSVFASRKI